MKTLSIRVPLIASILVAVAFVGTQVSAEINRVRFPQALTDDRDTKLAGRGGITSAIAAALFSWRVP